MARAQCLIENDFTLLSALVLSVKRGSGFECHGLLTTLDKLNSDGGRDERHLLLATGVRTGVRTKSDYLIAAPRIDRTLINTDGLVGVPDGTTLNRWLAMRCLVDGTGIT